MIDKYLEQVISQLDNTSVNDWQPDLVLPRNFLFYFWLIKYAPETNRSKFVEINKSLLLKYLGVGYEKNLETILVETELAEYVKIIQSSEITTYQILSDSMSKVQQVFERHYRLSQVLPFVDMSVTDYTRLFFSGDNQAVTQIQRAFQKLFNAISGTNPVFLAPGTDNTFSVHAPNWSCIIGVYSNASALNTAQMNEISAELNDARFRYNQMNPVEGIIPILLFAPNGDSFKAFRAPQTNPYTYHLTPLASLRFFRKIQTELFDNGWTHGELGEYFDAIFPFHIGQNSGLSELRAIERLIAKKNASA